MTTRPIMLSSSSESSSGGVFSPFSGRAFLSGWTAPRPIIWSTLLHKKPHKKSKYPKTARLFFWLSMVVGREMEEVNSFTTEFRYFYLTSSVQLHKQAVVAAHQSGNGYRAIQTIWSPCFNSEEDYSEVENIQDKKSPQEWTSQHMHTKKRAMTLQASVSMLKVKVHDSTCLAKTK